MAVRSLQHFCLAVPDPALGGKFYQDFGLEAEERGDSLAPRCAGRDQDQIILVEGPRRHLHHICLGTDEAGFEAVKTALQANATELLDPPARAPGEGLWFRDPACSACG
jgi:catechol 2,3-dioxygenase-like lactoylglutathione lyase family enzyme